MMRLLALFALSAAFLSCSPGNNSEQARLDSLRLDSIRIADSIAKIPPKPVIYKDTTLDNTARFIAGLPQLEANSLSALEVDKYWTDYKKSMDENWAKMVDQRLKPMDDWQKGTLAPLIQDSIKLFYPFSGPDFLHAETFYPNAPEYMMAALEPIIEIPSLEKLTVLKRDMFLDSLGRSLRDLFGKSYFITIHMMKDFRSIKGVLPIFYFFIQRTGNEMISQEFIGVNGEGFEEVIPYADYKKYNTHGVKIVFRNLETQELKTLYYFSTDISNGGLTKRPELVKFISNRGTYNAFVKSASYLMHHPDFTKIRDILLSQSASIFQDDTGIVYKDVKKTKQWNGYFYGEYVKPVSDFPWLEKQPDLDSAFAASKAPLPFSLGYHWSTKKQHYMLFVRKPK
jgi:hypothetical protein